MHFYIRKKNYLQSTSGEVQENVMFLGIVLIEFDWLL